MLGRGLRCAETVVRSAALGLSAEKPFVGEKMGLEQALDPPF
jgi:hypothetical protein